MEPSFDPVPPLGGGLPRRESDGIGRVPTECSRILASPFTPVHVAYCVSHK